MAKILADKDIKRLLDVCILKGSEDCIKPNSYELRLGSEVKFFATDERKKIEEGQFLEIDVGQMVSIASLETIDFTIEKVQQVFKKSMLMGFITPTTTMMREGFFLTATKIDAGFKGTLNWGIRNNSNKPIKLQYGEKLFKLTIFQLDPDESPEIPYGGRKTDFYQDSKGIVPSARKIPVDISNELVVRATKEKIDPKKQLQEAGYPFNHISTELIGLHGKFEIVSRDVAVLRDDFERFTKELSNKIDGETTSLKNEIDKIMDSIRNFVREEFKNLFNEKILGIYGTIITIASFCAAIYQGLLKSAPSQIQAWIFLGVGIIALIFTFLSTLYFSRKEKN